MLRLAYYIQQRRFVLLIARHKLVLLRRRHRRTGKVLFYLKLSRKGNGICIIILGKMSPAS